MFQGTAGLDVARRSLETDGAFVKTTVDMNLSEFSALEVGLIVVRVVVSKGYIVVATCPPNFGARDSDLFFLGKER